MKRLLLAAGGLGLAGVVFVPHLSASPQPPLAIAAQAASAAVPATGCTAGGGAGPAAAAAAFKAGFRGDTLVTAVAIAHAESGWNPAATNDNTNGSVDYGEWQINTVNAANLARGNWRDINDNAAMAFQIWQDAWQSFRPWVTFWDGAYQNFMDDAQAAVGGLSCGTGTDPGAGPQGPDGLRPRAEAIKAYTLATWGCGSAPQRADGSACVSSIGGFAARNIAGTSVVSDHATGRAVDLMLPADYHSAAAQALGRTMAAYWVANAKAAGVHYVIFNRRIWTSESGQWRPYQHPSGGTSDTLEHVNHCHVSVF